MCAEAPSRSLPSWPEQHKIYVRRWMCLIIHSCFEKVSVSFCPPLQSSFGLEWIRIFVSSQSSFRRPLTLRCKTCCNFQPAKSSQVSFQAIYLNGNTLIPITFSSCWIHILWWRTWLCGCGEMVLVPSFKLLLNINILPLRRHSHHLTNSPLAHIYTRVRKNMRKWLRWEEKLQKLFLKSFHGLFFIIIFLSLRHSRPNCSSPTSPLSHPFSTWKIYAV